VKFHASHIESTSRRYSKVAKNWKDLSDRVVKLVGLRTKPLGFKFLKAADELKDVEGIQRPAFKRTVCQFIGGSRYLGQAWGATAEDQFCQAGAWTLGVFPETPEAFSTGELYTDMVLGIATPEVARKIADGLPKNKDKFEAFAVMPLDGGAVAEHITFEPDMVIIYGEPGQLGMLTIPACAALGITVCSQQKQLLQWALKDFPEEMVEAENKRINESRNKLQSRKAELESQIEASDEAVVNIPKLEAYVQLIRDKLVTLDFDVKRLALDMLNIKVLLDGQNVEITGSIPVEDADVVTKSS
jgi:uncharacterized protein (DUF169 family)